ncbi:hypothetical protein EUA93_08610 [Nocardioides oleivorans]|uniref:Uncharacterized protein n=1 Tax=Nocardioides oleivorans TaxID=273676 RepID=A0A4Q2S247_9ACTN|nr:hypothetical protein [Nocardioides oleivorans]RYB94399.1 hypothetical protein EUA93_08610 [Nocardioides oleivorans]
MNAHRRLTVALAATALTLTSALAAGSPASASDGPGRTVPDTAPSAEGAEPLVAPVLGTPDAGRVTARASSARRPLFAFWGLKYNRLDGFGFQSAVRGSGTSIELAAAWKTYRGSKPLLPKVFVQARVDGGKWSKLKGAKGKIGKNGLVRSRVPAFTVTAGVPAQTVDYRFKTKKLKKGPKKARRSIASKPVSVRFENQAMYTGEQARFYAPIANLCPNSNVTIDTTGALAGDRAGVFDWQNGLTINPTLLATYTWQSEAQKLAVAIHECAHFQQFHLWGGTNESWETLVARSGEVFVPDNNPSGPTTPMAADWAPLEHAADCATSIITGGIQDTYGGYCNPAETAAAGLLWQGQRY